MGRHRNRLRDRLRARHVHDLDELRGRHRATKLCVRTIGEPIADLDDLGAQPCVLVGDLLRIPLGGEEEGRNARRDAPRDLPDRVLVDHARAARHLGHETQRRGSETNGRMGFVHTADAAHLDADHR